MDRRTLGRWALGLALAAALAACDDSNRSNSPPTVDAGADRQVVAGTEVSLTANASDSDGRIVAYEWRQIDGPTAQLSNTDTPTLTVRIPNVLIDASLTFRIKVTDDDNASAEDDVNLLVKPANPAPLADAGPDRRGPVTRSVDNVQTFEVVFLDGSASTGSDFRWHVTSAPPGGTGYFTSSATPITGFYGDAEGEYVITLEVSNGQGATASDSVTVTLIPDADGDGIVDADDLDRDGDSFLNEADAFPDDKASHLDSDGDGDGNYYTEDVDGDGTPDHLDDFPLDPTKTAYDTYTEARESAASNQNDGVTVAEAAGSPPKIINGVINASGGAPDLDYYALTWSAGRYSLVLTGADPAMTPTLAVIDRNGRAVASTTANVPTSRGNAALAVQIPSTDTYYLIVTDSSGTSDPAWSYSVRVFPDQDMDGIPDDLEDAIDSNSLTVDSDGDSIPDFVEISDGLAYGGAYRDLDGDGLPTWWDDDSDGDGIPDAVEYFSAADYPDLSPEELRARNDADGDGIPNYLDRDSDGNGIDDSLEVGLNPLKPDDTDGDGIPDYLDPDNDGDGLPDVQETIATYKKPLTYADEGSKPTQDALWIGELFNETLGVQGVCRAGDHIVISGRNFPASGLLVSFNTLDGPVIVAPSVIDAASARLVCPADIAAGTVEVFLIQSNERSYGLEVTYLDAAMPVLAGYTFDPVSGTLTLTGANLNASLAVNFTGASQAVNNAGGDPRSVIVPVPAQAQTGHLYVSSVAGDSNALYVQLTRLLTGTLQSPNPTVPMNRIDVSLRLDQEQVPADDGSFQTEAPRQGAYTLTTLVELPDSTEDHPAYAPYLMAVILPGEDNVVVNTASTALALVWSGLGVDRLVASNALADARQLIGNLPAVATLASRIETSLQSDLRALVAPDQALSSAMAEALLAAANAVAGGVENGTLATPRGGPRLTPRGLFGPPAKVTPPEADDISVYERGDTGNVTVENDTQLYLSVKITASNGEVLHPHITGLDGMAGPQGRGLLFWATSQDFDVPNGRNALVEVVTPGIGLEHEPRTMGPYAVWKVLFIRTVIERVIWPYLSEVLPLPNKDFVQILWGHAPTLIDITATKALHGDVSGAIGELVKALFNDMASVPPGPITQALAKRLGQDFAEKMLAKLAAKIGAKFVPGIGQISLAIEIAGHVNNGVNTAKAIADLGMTDAVIHFDVQFPLEVKAVVPDKIKPDLTPVTVTIEGTGFSEIERGLIWKSVLRPNVTFTDADGRSVTVQPSSIARDGTRMQVTIPGWWLDPDMQGPVAVEVHHPTDTPNAKAELNPAIEIVHEVELTSVAPSSGGAGISATVYGAGFARLAADNEVRFGDQTALITGNNQSSLRVVVPPSLEPGVYQVTARARFNGLWTEWSNPVPYEVVESQVAITVCDNGSAKDDAFALYVDGVYQGTMYARSGKYCETYRPTLVPGQHTAMLLGVEAPDSVGTYSISFSGVTNLTGDPRSGSDLTPGVRKHYTFEVPPPAQQQRAILTDQSLRKTAPYQPAMPDPEAAARR